jgi:hypothetical protein
LPKFDPVIQFYATPAEMAAWVTGWIQQHDLRYLFARLYFRGQPPKLDMLHEVGSMEPLVVANAVRDYSSLFLSANAIETNVSTFNQLSVINRNILRIDLPNINYRGLTACSWNVASEDLASLEKYRAIGLDLVLRTTEGVWFCQEGRRSVRIQPRMRYSPGAATLFEQGIPLCGGGRMVVGKLGLRQSRRKGRTSRVT